MSSTLIVRPGALGDALLTLPLIEALSREPAPAQLVVLGNPASWGFLPAEPLSRWNIDGREWLGLFDESAPLDAAARKRLAGIERAIVLLGTQRARVERALRRAGIVSIAGTAPPSRDEIGSGPPSSKPGVAEFAPWRPAAEHAAARFFAALAALEPRGGASAWPAPQAAATHPLLRPTPGDFDAALRTLGLPTGPARGILAIHPGSGGISKRWPVERFAAAAAAAERRWGVTPIFLLGPAEGRLAAPLEAALTANSPGAAPLILRERPLREVLALLSLARAYLGNDSGISHLAARACPTLALFGPSDPRVWHPLGPRAAVLRAPEGRLEALPVEAVLDGLALLL